MKKVTILQLQQLQLDILDAVTSFCDKQNIQYFLCGGTLIGAVRHKGFIPWDDDIDIMLPRPDYERLIHAFEHPELEVHILGQSKGYNKPFTKISNKNTLLVENIYSKYQIGVNIDVFPIDGLPGDHKKIKKHIKKISIYRDIYSLKMLKYRKGRSLAKNLYLALSKPFVFFIPGSYLLHKINDIAAKYDFVKSYYAAVSVWRYGMKEVNKQYLYRESTEVEFEGCLYKAPKDYNTYLKNAYGDYMQLPSKEKQVSHHNFKAYWK